MKKICAFTLIEVVIALSILAISITSAIVLTSNSSRISKHLEEKTFATMLANNIHDRLLTGEDGYNLSAEDTTFGSEVFAGRKWDWQAVISEEEGILDLNIKVKLSISENPIVTINYKEPFYAQ